MFDELYELLFKRLQGFPGGGGGELLKKSVV